MTPNTNKLSTINNKNLNYKIINTKIDLKIKFKIENINTY
jgi:hypothetical protein